MGDQDAGDGIFSPYKGTSIWNGETWNFMVADYAITGGVSFSDILAFDFNDDYFVGGDIIEYFYRAEAVNGYIVTFPEYATSSDEDLRSYYRVRCLPTPGTTLLLVEDDANLLPSWREAFTYNGYDDYDIYTTLSPGSGLQNNIASKADQSSISGYEVIVWDSGDVPSYTIADNGTEPLDKTSDAMLLADWLNGGTSHDTGLWVMGNAIAHDISSESFFTQVLGTELLFSDHLDDITDVGIPHVFAVHPGLEWCGGDPWFWVDGGGPTVENFSMVAPLAPLAETSHIWGDDGGTSAVAGVFNVDPDGNGLPTDPNGFVNRTLFNPFSYYHVRNGGYCIESGESYAHLMVGHVLNNLFGHLGGSPPDEAPELPAATSLQGGYPNPFNPTTTISFGLATREHVRLAVYDAGGRRVRTLVDGPMAPGYHDRAWDGRDDDGQRLASGVYLYRLYAGEYSDGGKLVLLK